MKKEKKRCLYSKDPKYEPYETVVLDESGIYFMIEAACFLGLCTEEKWVKKEDIELLN